MLLENMGTIPLTDLYGVGPLTYKTHHMHFHGPSEHKVNGTQYDLELHFVHELVVDEDTEELLLDKYKETLAVVGVMFKVADRSHPFIDKLCIDDFYTIESLDFNELFETENKPISASKTNRHEFFHYKGSLTTPPCSEKVNWNVFKNVLPISRRHLRLLKDKWYQNLADHNNNRMCQPLCGRTVAKNF